MIRITLILVLFLLPLWGNIDAQIEAIQRAPVTERFKLMNAFKKEIVQMKETERIQAMTKLQSITQSKHADKAFKELRSRTRNAKSHTRREIPRSNLQNGSRTEDAVENNVEQETENETENETEGSVENEVEQQTQNETENETEDSVENEVEQQTQNETEGSVENEVEQHTEDHIEREDFEENEHEEEHDDD